MNVSVVIPALNEEIIIEACLQSIRRQTVPVELILIDNGSIDQTPGIASKYCDDVLIKPGYTLAEMRDLGVRTATGDIIVTTDADCIAPENWIEELIKPFQDPTVVAVGGAFRPLNINRSNTCIFNINNPIKVCSKIAKRSCNDSLCITTNASSNIIFHLNRK